MKALKRIILFAILSQFLWANILVVDLAGGGDFTSIHTAVDDAVAGDSILITSGTYILSVDDGAITVDKALHIMGSGYDLPAQGGTLLQSSTQVFDFTSSADGSTLSGLRINGNGSPLINVSADDMIIEDNHIRNNLSQGHIMQLNTVSSDTIRNNIFTFNENINYRPGINLVQGTDLVVSNNIFSNFSQYGAVYIYNCINAKIVNNIFLHSQYATFAIGSATIANNIYMNNSSASYVQSGSPDILNNCFFNNTGDGTTGVDPILGDDPEFVDYTSTDLYGGSSYDEDGFDFNLQASSPCINTGYVLIDFNDLNGSRNDMGIYGWKWPMGTNGAPRLPIINQISVTPSGIAPGGTISIEVIGRFGD